MTITEQETEVQVKTFDLLIKEAGKDDGLEEGEFIGYASAFGNVDAYGDIVDEDAFDRTLKEWGESGNTIPVLWGHDTSDPFNNIGGLKTATAIKSGEKADGEKPGLKVHGFLDIGDNPTAAQVYRLMKGRRTRKMSFAYAVRDEKKEDDGLHLKDLDLFEVSVVQIPANDQAEIIDVKHALAPLLKAGRVLSRKNEASLKQARDAIDSVLKALESDDESESGEDEKGAPAPSTSTVASGDADAKSSVPDEDRASDKSGASDEEPKQDPSVEVWDAEFTLLSTAFAGKD